MRGVIPFGVLLAATASASAHAERATVILGDHANYGRLVIEFAAATPATITEHGSRIDISIPTDAEIVAPDRVPRNVLSFRGGPGKASIVMAPGARLKPAQSGRLIILDILDPRTRSRGAKAALATRLNPDRGFAALASVPPAAPPTLTSPLALAAKPVPAPQLAAPLPSPSAELQERAPVKPARASIHVSAGPDVGAVAFRRGDSAVIVFDDTVEVDTDDAAADRDAPSVQHRQGGTILTLALGDAETLSLGRDETGWIVKSGAPTAAPAAQTAAKNGIAFQFSRPGRTMTISDPVTGQLLLLGTVRQAMGAQSAIDQRRAAPGYVLLPTWLGLALEVSSDAVDLRVSPSGFTLQVPDAGAPGSAIATGPENGFKIPTGPNDVLMRQLDAQIASAAVSPPRGRGPERVAAARTMLALGMAAEAQALLDLAANDDPAIASDPQTAALQGIAAILAGRPDEARGLDDANLPAGNDLAMWRGIRDAATGKAAPLLASAWPALAGYSPAIRQRIGPTVIEAAVETTSTVPLSDIDGPAYAFARARRQERDGDVDGAIESFTAVANGRDERNSVRATVALTELRLKQKKIAPVDAADTIERQTVRWRGDSREQDMRLRAAELRAQAGQFRAALEILKETETLFPKTKERVAAQTTDVFQALLAAKQDSIKPLEVVTIAGDFADRLPQGQDGERLAAMLADKLAALDLPSRAVPILQRLAEQTSSPKARADYLLRLAQLQIDAADPAKVESTLAALNSDQLSPPQQAQRLFLMARARAGQGDPAAAAATLATFDDPASAELRAGMLAKAGDWPGSLNALQSVLANTVPDKGELTDKQEDLVLRTATAAVHAADRGAIAQMKRFAGRLTGPRADLFKVLTASAVESPDDLPRAAQELAMARTVPDRLNALKLR